MFEKKSNLEICDNSLIITLLLRLSWISFVKLSFQWILARWRSRWRRNISSSWNEHFIYSFDVNIVRFVGLKTKFFCCVVITLSLFSQLFQELVIIKEPGEKLGMHIKGGLRGQRGNPLDHSDEGVFISKINSGGAAKRDGRLKVSFC